MESRKYQLKKQIIEASKTRNNDLYVLLKSQWAHRFGVESLEELNNLDLNAVNKKNEGEDDQKIYETQSNFLENNVSINSEKDDIPEINIKNDCKSTVRSVEQEYKEINKIKSYEIKQGNNHNHQDDGNKNIPKVKALIPLPPKAKYNYLEKWLLKN